MSETAIQRRVFDVVILGGGVAGLWLLNRLVARGYRTLLLEADRLGAGQTRYAQGIIHGGTKYALTGRLTESADAVAQMPAVWRACLEGRGEIDLSRVVRLSDHQHLWSTANLTSRMAGFFASKLMRSRTATLDPADYPPLFRDPRFSGQLYRLDEPVLDTASLVEALAAPCRGQISRFDLESTRFDPSHPTTLTLMDGEARVQIEAQALVLTAGKGNQTLLQRLGRSHPAQQLRPLQMVVVRGELPEGIYAHCLGASSNPRVTISTHRDADGQTVWYLGGQLAEQGASQGREALIAAAKAELASLFPWLDLSGCDWSTLPIDRAEPHQADGSRPSEAFAEWDAGVITAWPTKLALSPQLADKVERLLEKAGVTATAGEEGLAAWPHPDIAPLPWCETARWYEEE